ncbi:MAG: hypothetical protein AAGI72_15345 [Pseudomonadota bacterium]
MNSPTHPIPLFKAIVFGKTITAHSQEELDAKVAELKTSEGFDQAARNAMKSTWAERQRLQLIREGALR